MQHVISYNNNINTSNNNIIFWHDLITTLISNYINRNDICIKNTLMISNIFNHSRRRRRRRGSVVDETVGGMNE